MDSGPGLAYRNSEAATYLVIPTARDQHRDRLAVGDLKADVVRSLSVAKVLIYVKLVFAVPKHRIGLNLVADLNGNGRARMRTVWNWVFYGNNAHGGPRLPLPAWSGGTEAYFRERTVVRRESWCARP
jgi:hypothetical protein